MKKLIFLFILVLAVAIIYGYKQSAQNEMAEKYQKPATPKDLKDINNTKVSKSDGDINSFKSEIAHEGRPRILFMLSKDAGQAAWSPSLWWKYEHVKAGQPGC
jgi:hypothetical protein